jgi:hypothetical protein
LVTGGDTGDFQSALDDLNLAADPAFAVNHLPAFFGSHAGAKADFTSAFDGAGLVGIMHVKLPKTDAPFGGRSLAFF